MKPDYVGSPVYRGERNCTECGRPHDAYQLRTQPDLAPQWSDPTDGHPYRPESWEQIARRLMTKEAA